jgi:hypothetical protein
MVLYNIVHSMHFIVINPSTLAVCLLFCMTYIYHICVYTFKFVAVAYMDG